MASAMREGPKHCIFFVIVAAPFKIEIMDTSSREAFWQSGIKFLSRRMAFDCLKTTILVRQGHTHGLNGHTIYSSLSAWFCINGQLLNYLSVREGQF